MRGRAGSATRRPGPRLGALCRAGGVPDLPPPRRPRDPPAEGFESDSSKKIEGAACEGLIAQLRGRSEALPGEGSPRARPPADLRASAPRRQRPESSSEFSGAFRMRRVSTRGWQAQGPPRALFSSLVSGSSVSQAPTRVSRSATRQEILGPSCGFADSSSTWAPAHARSSIKSSCSSSGDDDDDNSSTDNSNPCHMEANRL